jgi:transglutaminase-like putative cysteine protease
MLIRVEHSTEYAFSEPLVASTQYLRLTPLSGRTQAVEGWKVSCPGAVTHQGYDQYVNCCHTLTVAQPVTELAIKIGWVSFDPSNRTGATDSYIRTAIGLDYAEAGPIRGVRSGGGVETMTYSVMFPSQQQQAQ